MRGTCCYYQAPESQVDGGDGLCTTCPRRTDDERIRLVDAHLRAGRRRRGSGPAAAAGPGEG